MRLMNDYQPYTVTDYKKRYEPMMEIRCLPLVSLIPLQTCW
jgi:hypothetical protein